MAQPTHINLFDDNDKVSSVNYDETNNTLTVVFTQSLTPLQQFTLFAATAQKWLVQNLDDQSLNVTTQNLSQQEAYRNSQNKTQINMNFKIYQPSSTPTIDVLAV